MSRFSLRKGFAFVAAFLLVGAAVAIAVATHGSASKAGPLAFGKASAQDLVGNRGEPGEGNEAKGEDPAGAAVEAFEARAYPADDIPFSATVNAVKAWNRLDGKSRSGQNNPGQWALAGPSTANYPNVLTFSGADYTASGRVTALAVDPSCKQSKCTVWVGGCGRRCLADGQRATPETARAGRSCPAAFATNAIGTLTYDAATRSLRRNGRAERLGRFRGRHGPVQVDRQAATRGRSWPRRYEPVHYDRAGRQAATRYFDAGERLPGSLTYSGPLSMAAPSPMISERQPSMYVVIRAGVRGISSVTGGVDATCPRPAARTGFGSPRTAARASRCQLPGRVPEPGRSQERRRSCRRASAPPAASTRWRSIPATTGRANQSVRGAVRHNNAIPLNTQGRRLAIDRWRRDLDADQERAERQP